ncbi:MAG: rhomboid family intramembrane serine protease [Marinifilaceae bacterium]
MRYDSFSGNNNYGAPGYNEGGGVWNGIKQSFKHGTALTRLIYINVGVFLVIKLISAFTSLFGVGQGFYNVLLANIGVPAYFYNMLHKPWTLFTYMFTHFEFFHILFNMLWLYWFGKMFMNFFSGRKLVGVYIMGGLSGAALYLLTYNLLPHFSLLRYTSFAVGASASIMAIVFAVCFYVPQQRIYLFLIGPVKLIYLALFTAVIDLISMGSGNAGGHIAHLGGALFGICFSMAIRRNRDITSGVTGIFQWVANLFKPRPKMRVKHRNMSQKKNGGNPYSEDRINAILDKISTSGYESLSREEKEILFKSGGQKQ